MEMMTGDESKRIKWTKTKQKKNSNESRIADWTKKWNTTTVMSCSQKKKIQTNSIIHSFWNQMSLFVYIVVKNLIHNLLIIPEFLLKKNGIVYIAHTHTHTKTCRFCV